MTPSINEVIVRYVRPIVIDGPRGGKKAQHGGITIVAQINHDTNAMVFGWSVCSNKDNFSRKIGRELALIRFSVFPVITEYHRDIDIVSNVFRMLYDDAPYMVPNMTAVYSLFQGKDMTKLKLSADISLLRRAFDEYY